MGGKGGSASIPREVEEAARTLQGIGREQLDLSLPILERGGADALTILQGGTPASLRPAILSALESGRADASRGLTATRENLTRQGITGTALQEALAGAELGAAQGVAGIPSQFTQPVLQAGASQVLGLPAQGLQSLGSAASAGANAAIPGRQSGGALGGLGGAAGGAASGALLGSVVPGIGTAVGAVGGGLLGGAKGAK